MGRAQEGGPPAHLRAGGVGRLSQKVAHRRTPHRSRPSAPARAAADTVSKRKGGSQGRRLQVAVSGPLCPLAFPLQRAIESALILLQPTSWTPLTERPRRASEFLPRMSEFLRLFPLFSVPTTF